jgi:hypothetical protein
MFSIQINAGKEKTKIPGTRKENMTAENVGARRTRVKTNGFLL